MELSIGGGFAASVAAFSEYRRTNLDAIMGARRIANMAVLLSMFLEFFCYGRGIGNRYSSLWKAVEKCFVVLSSQLTSAHT
jgi:hypothetical protein